MLAVREQTRTEYDRQHSPNFGCTISHQFSVIRGKIVSLRIREATDLPAIINLSRGPVTNQTMLISRAGQYSATASMAT